MNEYVTSYEQGTSNSSVKTASILTEYKAMGTEDGEGFGVEFSMLPASCLDSGLMIGQFSLVGNIPLSAAFF